MIQGCGYPDYSLSHDESRDHLADRRTRCGSALRRHRLGRPPSRGRATPAATFPASASSDSVAPRVPADRHQRARHRQPRGLRLPLRRLRPTTTSAAKRAAFLALYADGRRRARSRSRSYIGNTGIATLLSSESYPAGCTTSTQTDRPQPFNDAYDDVDRSTARDLREIAKVIYGVGAGRCRTSTRASSSSSNGGYDTHSDQGGGRPDGQHYGLHASSATRSRSSTTTSPTWASARPGVHRRCGASSAAASRRTTTAPTTARRGRCSSIGGGVNGGVYGNHPNITQTRSTTTATPSTRRPAVTLPLDRLPRRLRHDPEALAQHAQARHPGERAAARRRQSRELSGRRRTSTWASCRRRLVPSATRGSSSSRSSI